MMRFIGITLATGLTVASVTGIAALIAKDFDGVFDPLIAGSDAASINVQYPFEDIDTINFFVSSPIDGVDSKITTGAAFSSAENVANSNPTSLWCYLSYGGDEGAITSRLDLGGKIGADAPVFTNLNEISNEEFNAIGVDRTTLARLARSHCKFSNFDPRNTSS